MTIQRWITVLLRSLTVTRTILFFWIYFLSSDASICSSIALPPMENFDHAVVSVSIDFPSNSKQDTPFHSIAYDYSRSDWESLHDYLRDIQWEDVFKFSAFVAAS